MIIAPDDPNLAEALLDQRFTRRYLAEGDSWFSLGGLTGNLLMAIDSDTTLIVNCATPGDTLEDLGGDLFARMLEPTDGLPQWDAVLLSGGGNDLLACCAQFIVSDPADPIDNDALLDVLNAIENELYRLLWLCHASAPGMPVLLHTYDYPAVSRRWWPWKLGPWVAPVLQHAGIDRSRWDGISAMLIDAMAERLNLLSFKWPGIGVIDTRGRLAASNWRNEIHPNFAGYRELAIQWRKTLANLNRST